MRGFASDNYSGVLPQVLEVLKRVNKAHAPSYGNDDITQKAIKKFRQLFGDNTDVYFVFNGTGANVLALSTITKPYHSILCATTSHINVDECGAPEKHTGCKVIAIPTADGKLRSENITNHLIRFGDEHHSQPKVISITQSTELGTVYQPDEIKELANLAHNHNMFLHMDGARISNATASLNIDIREITINCGVDVLSFGGTKNGMLLGEAVIFFNPLLSKNAKYIRKQNMQLASKMRYISAQFDAMLTNYLWLKTAKKANKMAQLLSEEIDMIPQIKITQKVEANEVFAILPKEIIPQLQEEFFFYVWNDETSEVRWVCSFDTEEEDIYSFVKLIKSKLKNIL